MVEHDLMLFRLAPAYVAREVCVCVGGGPFHDAIAAFCDFHEIVLLSNEFYIITLETSLTHRCHNNCRGVRVEQIVNCEEVTKITSF